MYDDHTVGVVIPAYNETGFVGDVLETVPDYVDRIYPVDDCSTDGTWAEIKDAAARVDGDSAVTNDASGVAGDHRSATEPRSDGGVQSSGNGTVQGTVEDGTHVDAESAVEALPDDLDFSPATAGAAGGTNEGGFRRCVVPIRHEENRGVGGAIKTGYQRARADRIDVTVVMGGDGQMDPDWMADLIEPVVDGRAEYAKGNRLILEEHHETMPRHRVVGNHTLTILTKIATGYWSVGDPQNGYTAISLEALDTAGIDELYEFFGYCNDLLIRLSTENLRVADVPCPLTYADEESHITYSTYVPRVSGMLLRSFLRRLWVDRDGASGRGRLALFLGGAVATLGGLLGVLSAGLSTARAEQAGEKAEMTGAKEEMTGANERATGAKEEMTGESEAVSGDNAEAPDASTESGTDGDDSSHEQRATQSTRQPDLDVESEPAAEAASSVVAESSEAVPIGEAVSSSEAGTSRTTAAGVSVCRSALLAVAGVVALLAAMLLDAVTNSTDNYTERVPEGAEPRVGNPDADESGGAPAE